VRPYKLLKKRSYSWKRNWRWIKFIFS